jgi:hypothetical protein
MTNIVILAFALLGGNTNQMTYAAPAGIYAVEYNLTEPRRAAQGDGIWRTSQITLTNTVPGVNVVTFTVPPVPALSLRLKKL